MTETLALAPIITAVVSLATNLSLDLRSLVTKYKRVPRELLCFESECRLLNFLLFDLQNRKDADTTRLSSMVLRGALDHIHFLLTGITRLLAGFGSNPTITTRFKWILSKDEVTQYRESLATSLSILNLAVFSGATHCQQLHSYAKKREISSLEFKGVCVWVVGGRLVRKLAIDDVFLGSGTLRIIQPAETEARIEICLNRLNKRARAIYRFTERTQVYGEAKTYFFHILGPEGMSILEAKGVDHVKGPKTPLLAAQFVKIMKAQRPVI
ncbi:hypothetical protein TWF102_008094 [Orbilia oligospora]|uniref:Fungal N-terminal domain-containing protein n=1 Tax=Orbilia oligospora TaxID=2813651 RepID=A0A7C8NHP7_ORBOL|nr:hypothetical protein TWF706_009830 [Orbilia oligospora]KAF3110517.1 hypothetical protein TWF102_008094 [Orbilia oligospora]